MAKTNLFAAAKANSTKKAVEKHEIVTRPDLESTVTKMTELNAKIAELEAERELLDSELREAGKEAMINLYNAKKSFPGTLKVVAGNGNYMFITSDRYKKIDDEQFNELAKKYGENIVEETTVFSFNTAILMKHMEHISDLLMGSKKLSEEDKANLLTSETSYSVKKGAIKELFSFKGVKKVDTIVEDIQPVYSIKSVQTNE
jgi:hypothetical protein